MNDAKKTKPQWLLDLLSDLTQRSIKPDERVMARIRRISLPEDYHLIALNIFTAQALNTYRETLMDLHLPLTPVCRTLERNHLSAADMRKADLGNPFKGNTRYRFNRNEIEAAHAEATKLLRKHGKSEEARRSAPFSLRARLAAVNAMMEASGPRHDTASSVQAFARHLLHTRAQADAPAYAALLLVAARACRDAAPKAARKPIAVGPLKQLAVAA